MAVRGVYSEAEKKLLEDTNRDIDEYKVGWAHCPNPVVSAQDIKNRGGSLDPWNPLWRDEKYAAATGWGSIIAFPCLDEQFGAGTINWKATPECGKQAYLYFGDDFEFFQPICPDDTIRAWCRRPNIIDTTDLDGKGPRCFECLGVDSDKINQRDELVSTEKKYTGRIYYTEFPDLPYIPDYGYTEEEIKYLYDIACREKIRGRIPRFWEDVEVGEATEPVIFGPTSMVDVARMNIGGPPPDIPPRIPPNAKEGTIEVSLVAGHVYAYDPWQFIPDDEAGVYYTAGFAHYDDRSAQATGETRPFLFAVQARHTMVRLITNWMGDDGFIREFKWRHMARSIVGDALVGRGIVVGKRQEDDENLVELKVWLENIRGFVSEASVATISLLSKKDGPYNTVLR